MNRNDVIEALNDLVENCKDGEYGFERTAEHAQSEQLKRMLDSRTDSCRVAARELQVLIVRLGGKPADDGTLSGAVHRGWVTAKGTLAGYDDVNMLKEAERGEGVAVARYRKALDQDLPRDIHDVVQRQYEGAKRNLLQISQLVELAKAPKP